MVFGLISNICIALFCGFLLYRMSPGKPEDPRASHSEAGSSPGSSDQRRKGLCSSSDLPHWLVVVLGPPHWVAIATHWFLFSTFRRMAFSLLPLIRLRTSSRSCKRGAARCPLNPRPRGSRGWPCSAWPQWYTSCIPVALQSGRWRSRPYWRATSSSWTGTARWAVTVKTSWAGRKAWSPSRAKC